MWRRGGARRMGKGVAAEAAGGSTRAVHNGRKCAGGDACPTHLMHALHVRWQLTAARRRVAEAPKGAEGRQHCQEGEGHQPAQQSAGSQSQQAATVSRQPQSAGSYSHQAATGSRQPQSAGSYSQQAATGSCTFSFYAGDGALAVELAASGKCHTRQCTESHRAALHDGAAVRARGGGGGGGGAHQP